MPSDEITKQLSAIKDQKQDVLTESQIQSYGKSIYVELDLDLENLDKWLALKVRRIKDSSSEEEPTKKSKLRKKFEYEKPISEITLALPLTRLQKIKNGLLDTIASYQVYSQSAPYIEKGIEVAPTAAGATNSPVGKLFYGIGEKLKGPAADILAYSASLIT